jgi:hypothetical protein
VRFAKSIVDYIFRWLVRHHQRLRVAEERRHEEGRSQHLL